jgi:predicted DNA-binding transcriptional regulator AlpA
MKIHPGEFARAGTLLTGYLSPEEVAEELQICKRTLDRWHAARRGPPRVVIGRRPMYRREAVTQWLIKREKAFDEERPRGQKSAERNRSTDFIIRAPGGKQCR